MFLPSQKPFRREIRDTGRYKDIKECLQQDETKIYLAFAIFLADILEEFLVGFQSGSPMVFVMYDGFEKLLYNLMATFMKQSAIMNRSTRLEARELGRVNLKNVTLQKTLNSCNPGARARRLISELESQKKDLTMLKTNLLLCLIDTTQYLQEHLPLESTFLRDARCLNTENKNMGSAFGRLAYMMCVVLKNTNNKQPDEFSDVIKRQYSHYQTVPFDRTAQVEEFWRKVDAYIDPEGRRWFAQLANLARNCLVVSHGNADAERGFSINKNMLHDRLSMNESTIVALRLVKQSIELHGGQVSSEKSRYHYFPN